MILSDEAIDGDFRCYDDIKSESGLEVKVEAKIAEHRILIMRFQQLFWEAIGEQKEKIKTLEERIKILEEVKK